MEIAKSAVIILTIMALFTKSISAEANADVEKKLHDVVPLAPSPSDAPSAAAAAAEAAAKTALNSASTMTPPASSSASYYNIHWSASRMLLFCLIGFAL